MENQQEQYVANNHMLDETNRNLQNAGDARIENSKTNLFLKVGPQHNESFTDLQAISAHKRPGS